MNIQRCSQTGKKMYVSLTETNKRLQRLKEKKYTGQAYLCRFCSHWHVGRRKKMPRVRRYSF